MKSNMYKIISLAIIILLVIPTISSADYYSGGRTSPIFTSYYDSSVSSYGYTAHYDAARSAWNIPSKVVISKSSTNGSTYDEYYVGTTATVGLLGQTIPYKNGPLGTHKMASLTETWVYSTVALYDNQMNAAPALGYTDRVAVATHELGHSLAQAHNTTLNLSIMDTPYSAGLSATAPNSFYDFPQLKAKWGITP